MSEAQKFFNAIEGCPISSAYTLGNLLLAPDSLESKNSIHNIKLFLTQNPEKIKTCWQKVSGIPAPTWQYILSQANRDSLSVLKHWMISEDKILNNIGEPELIALGQDLPYARKALIALIRSHNTQNNSLFIKFNYHLLDQAGVDQNSESVLWRTIKKCDTLPIEAIKLLGKTNPDIAQTILIDIHDHPDKFIIARFFYETHSSLRTLIFNNWKNSLSTLPLTQKQTDNLQAQAKILAKDYPEFATLATQQRLRRCPPPIPPKPPSFWQRITSKLTKVVLAIVGVLSAMAAGLLYYFRSSPIVSSVAKILPATPYVLSYTIAPILTVYGLYKAKKCYEYKTEYKTETKPDVGIGTNTTTSTSNTTRVSQGNTRASHLSQ